MPFAKTKNFTESKVWNTTPKKTHWKNRGAQKSVEKMQARGKTCLLQHTTNTTHSELRKGASKYNRKWNTQIQPQPQNVMSHHVMMIRGRHPPLISHSSTLKPLHGGWWRMTNGKRQMPHHKPAKCNYVAQTDSLNPEIQKAVNRIALKSCRNDAWQRS